MDITVLSQGLGKAENRAATASTGNVQIDPKASAALEAAIKSAKLGLKPTSPEVAASRDTAARRRTSPARVLSQAAIALLLVGAGWSASYLGTLANQDAIGRLEAETSRSQEILGRLSADLASLRETVVAFKDVEHTGSTSSATERTELTEKIERLAITLQEPGQKLSALEGRIDRMESQILTTLAGLNTKPAAPATAPATEARVEPPAPKPVKSEPVDGWVLREVYDGMALVENRNRRLYEVMPGGVLPGVGRIEAIERRGARWVVVTDKGFIGAYR